MAAQMMLFSDTQSPITEPDYTPAASIQERFEQFHRDNPHVLRYLAAKCIDLRRRGIRQWSIGAAFEVARYDYMLSTGGDAWKLNNNFRSRYARLLVQEYPELDGFFETRELKTK